jgi:hypothetical protein
MITSKVMKENDPMVANLELIKSLRNGDFSGASKALSKGGDPDSTVEDGNDLFTLTHLAAKNGFSICLSLLIRNDNNFIKKSFTFIIKFFSILAIFIFYYEYYRLGGGRQEKLENTVFKLI